MKKNDKLPVYGRGKSPFRKKDGVSYPTADGSIKADILIIGGGLAGILCAYSLAEKGIQAVICESGGVGEASTSYAPPYISAETDITLSGLTRKYGYEKAIKAFTEMRNAVQKAKAVAEKVGDSCGFALRDSFIYAGYDLPGVVSRNKITIADEYRLRRFSGFACERLDEKECAEAFSFRCIGGIYEKNAAAEINAVSLCEATAAYLSVMGIGIFEDSPVTELVRTSNAFRAVTGDKNAEITATTVIDCRGLRQKQGLLRQKTVYAALTPPQKDFFGWKNRCLLRSIDKNPFIACTTEDKRIYVEGFPGRRLLGSVTAEYAFKKLELTAEDMFFGTGGEAPEVFYERTVSFSPDGLPYMGRVEGEEGMWQICAAGRCGLAGALTAAELISGAISGDLAAKERLREYETF